MIIAKGIMYIVFLGLYLAIGCGTATILAVLSGLAGLLHTTSPFTNLLNDNNYGLVMGVYCVLQFIVFTIGLGRWLYRRHDYSLWDYLNHHGSKGA